MESTPPTAQARADVAEEVKEHVVQNPADLFARMIRIGHRQKLPMMQAFLNNIHSVTQRAGISVRDHLGFGYGPDVVLSYFED